MKPCTQHSLISCSTCKCISHGSTDCPVTSCYSDRIAKIRASLATHRTAHKGNTSLLSSSTRRNSLPSSQPKTDSESNFSTKDNQSQSIADSDCAKNSTQLTDVLPNPQVQVIPVQNQETDLINLLKTQNA